ncbi:hypothetical protein C8034_v007125 [Colletotrichum sidae]|uniref:Mid2 domain-containing protein n=1 Tax=Colletotrichum sidae TaxID=1347389 RepID=A0A4R8T415_9PEZI|nr:hypothetical protein C8034_v007125 [Colletotrichum sidae]
MVCLRASFYWSLAIAFATASVPSADVIVRNSPGKTAADTFRAIRRRLSSATIEGRESKFSSTTSLDKSFDNAVLFRFAHEAEVGQANVTAAAGINIVCTKCYIKGRANAHLTIDGTFNATEVAEDIGSEFRETFDNLTDYAETYVSGVVDKLKDGFDAEDFDFPPLNVTFDLPVPEFPQCKLGFGFDDFEMYMELDTTLSAGLSYTLNLYTSTTPLGSRIGDDLLLGVVFNIDLILSVESEVQMTSGFHIKLDDGVAFDIALFSKNVSSVAFNGGRFEFLPVTISSAGAVLKAVLRIGINAGIEIASPVDGRDFTAFDRNVTVPGASAGVEVAVFANIAELSTNVTARAEADETGCALRAVNAYQFALGAAAGASVAIGHRVWGPTPGTQVPIFYTTLADGCASGRAPTATLAAVSAAPTEGKRRDEELTTTTLRTRATYTGVECLTTGLVNCPPALQTLRKFVATETFVTAVASGVTAVFPAATEGVVRDVASFGSGVKSIVSTSGVPRAYTPAISAAATGSAGGPGEIFTAEVGGVDKKVVVGVSVGAGVLVMVVLVGACVYWRKRRQYAPVAKSESVVLGQMSPESYRSAPFDMVKEPKSRFTQGNESQL